MATDHCQRDAGGREHEAELSGNPHARV